MWLFILGALVGAGAVLTLLSAWLMVAMIRLGGE